MRKVRAIVVHEFGAPASVARCEEIELPALGEGDALVEIAAAPINPADLNVLEGRYPIRPDLPGVPGVEGAAFVREIGAAVRGLAVGDLVLLPHRLGTWREAAVAPAAELRRVPEGISPAQAAMLKINPATALRMLRDFVPLQPGEWVVQNAANSGVGRAVIEIARECGCRTINVVRRAELIDELKATGADVVLVESESLTREIASVLRGAPLRLALNAVGGESALRLASALSEGGVIVTYGAMGRQPVRAPNSLLIFRDVQFRGFWVSRWYGLAPAAVQAEMFEELFTWAKRGHFQPPIGHTYALIEAAAALAHAAQDARGGKILFTPHQPGQRSAP
jgi:trans-2-enoyl-CoA reductase